MKIYFLTFTCGAVRMLRPMLLSQSLEIYTCVHVLDFYMVAMTLYYACILIYLFAEMLQIRIVAQVLNIYSCYSYHIK